MKREDMIQTFPKILDLVGKSMYVAVSVLTSSGKELSFLYQFSSYYSVI